MDEIIEINEDDIDSIENNTFFDNIDNYQQNINDRYLNFNNDIDFTVNCLPLIFFQDYENVKCLEYSNKILLPKSILYQISNYDNMTYPLHFKINDSENIFGVFEFYDFIDNIFIPKKFFNQLNIEFNDEIKLTLLKKEIDKGEYIKIQPHNSSFLEINNVKDFLENNLKKLYSCLSENDTIDLPHNEIDNFGVYFNIIECKPSKTISIIDTNLEVDFEKPIDYVEKPQVINNVISDIKGKNINKDIDKNINENNEAYQDHQDNQNKPFVAFSGKGYSLKD